MSLKNAFEENTKIFWGRCLVVEKMLEKKQLEIIKEYDPSYEGTVDDFFLKHTEFSQHLISGKKYYNFRQSRLIPFDKIDVFNNYGYVYDNTGKSVYNKIKKTREYKLYQYFSKMVEKLVDVSLIDFSKGYHMESSDFVKDDDNEYKKS